MKGRDLYFLQWDGADEQAAALEGALALNTAIFSKENKGIQTTKVQFCSTQG